MNTETVYAALRDYIDTALSRMAAGVGESGSEGSGGSAGGIGADGLLAGLEAGSCSVPDTKLQVEVAEGDCGEEWTGIRMSKLPSSLTGRRYISGGALVGMTFQMFSKQRLDGGRSSVIYAACLENLAGTLRSMFRAGIRPVLPNGMELYAVEAVQQSSLNYADAAFSGYVLDLRFTIKTRSV